MNSSSVEMTVADTMSIGILDEGDGIGDEGEGSILLSSSNDGSTTKTSNAGNGIAKICCILSILALPCYFLIGRVVPAAGSSSSRSPIVYSVRPMGDADTGMWRQRGRVLSGPSGRPSAEQNSLDLTLSSNGNRITWIIDEGFSIADWREGEWTTVSTQKHQGQLISIHSEERWVVAAQLQPEPGTAMWDMETGALKAYVSLSTIFEFSDVPVHTMIARVNVAGFVITSFQTATSTGSHYYALPEDSPLGSIVEFMEAVDALSMDFSDHVHAVIYRRRSDLYVPMATNFLINFVGGEQIVPIGAFRVPNKDIVIPRACALSKSGQTLSVMADFSDQNMRQVYTYSVNKTFHEDDLFASFMEAEADESNISLTSPPLSGDWTRMALSGSGTRVAVANSNHEISVWSLDLEINQWTQVGDVLHVVSHGDGKLTDEAAAVSDILVKLSFDGNTLAVGLTISRGPKSGSTSTVTVFDVRV